MTDTDAAEAYLNEGLGLFDQGLVEQAFESFRNGHETDPGNARLRSYYGLCLGLVERNFEESSELCRSAAKQEFFNPSLYLNLARLHLTFDFRNEGMRYLQRGRMIDPGNLQIESELADLGRRTPPILQFLPRRHLLNRWLGFARYRFAERTAARSLA